jgi:plasmid maintenance system antidote protein VapI
MSATLTNKEFENLLSSPQDEKWKRMVRFRKANKEWLSMSSEIAMKVMDEMEKQGIKSNELAIRMKVSPQQVSKILKGRENLKLETIAKLNEALGVKLVTILQEDQIVIKNDMSSLMKTIANEIRQHFTTKLPEVIQHPKEVTAPLKTRIARDFSLTSDYVRERIEIETENYALRA